MGKGLMLGVPAMVLLLPVLSGCASAELHGQPEGLLTVMTFNLRYASDVPPNAWAQRRPVMKQAIRLVAPDVIGTQEGLYRQLRDLEADLPEYAWIGTGRDGGSRGEFMAVFYRKERLEPLEYDHFWLSDTPQVIASSTWGNRCRRMCTWVRFRDRATGNQFYFFNTHLDHEVQLAREKAAVLICQRIEALKTDLPVIVLGDFNADARASRVYDIFMEAGFSDAWFSAARRAGQDVATYHGYKRPIPGGPHIDWILYRGPCTVQEAEIIQYSRGEQYPSDHYPVVARMHIGAASRIAGRKGSSRQHPASAPQAAPAET